MVSLAFSSRVALQRGQAAPVQSAPPTGFRAPGASHPGFSDRELAELAAPWLDDAGREGFYRQIEQFDPAYLEGIERRCADFAIPVHILWGDQDAWIPPDTAPRLAGLIPSASYEYVPGAGHLVQHDAPAFLADRLRRWLTDGGQSES